MQLSSYIYISNKKVIGYTVLTTLIQRCHTLSVNSQNLCYNCK